MANCFKIVVALTFAGSILVSCKSVVQQSENEPRVIKTAFKDKFYIGVAVNRQQAVGKDATGQNIIKQHFNSLSPENDLKWEKIHPKPEVYDFTAADAYVNFGTQNNMFTIGHTLVWHSQTPDWVFEDYKGKPLTREALLTRLEEHINTVVGRYKGKIKGWDVVNEALNEDGTLRDSKWLKIIGEDFIAKAFEFAQKADPEAELYYNDYNLYKAEKRAGAVRIIKSLKGKGIKITAVGEQAHYSLAEPDIATVEKTIIDFAATGVAVNFTELDINVLPDGGATNTADVSNTAQYSEKYNPYVKGLPVNVIDSLASRYGSLFRLFVKYDASIDRITFWGLTDGDSWLNDWPIRGRTNYPLLYNRDFTIKQPVKDAILKSLK
ncbi:endo-1,4-beta-xylanase [Flavobacterium psychrotrophum]|uniref:endo-1,4-beta-xylanase n=1 Tax=Flavobacterium psychrotrophum TaxID=2294119 RepID=UPI000E30DBB7|nr:endo-1,4-beta-xylanase [Flavobacterium psychrotrophum]